MLEYWFLYRLDFFQLCYGTAFLLIAAVCFVLYRNFNKEKQEQPVIPAVGQEAMKVFPWLDIGVSTFLSGLANWAIILLFAMRDSFWPLSVTIFLYLLSYSWFYRFVSRTSDIFETKSQVSFEKILAVTVIASAVAYFCNYETGLYLFFLGIGIPLMWQGISGFYAAYRRSDEKEFRYLGLFAGIIYSIKLIIFACPLIAGGYMLRANSDIGSVFVALQIANCFIACFAAFHVWKFAKKNLYANGIMLRGHFVPVILSILLAVGFFYTEFYCELYDNDYRLDLLRFGANMARVTNPAKEEIEVLRKGITDKEAIKAYRDRCLVYKETRNDIDCILSFFEKNGKFHIGPNTLDMSESTASMLGKTYNSHNELMTQVFKTGKPAVAGLLRDCFGEFISAFLPIVVKNTNGKKETVGVMAVNANAETWKKSLEWRRTEIDLIMMYVILFPMLGLIVTILWNREKQNNRVLAIPAIVFIYFLGITIIATCVFVEHKNRIAWQRFTWLAHSRGQIVEECFGKIATAIENLNKYIPDKEKGFANYEQFQKFSKEYLLFNSKPMLKVIDRITGREIAEYEERIKQEHGFENYAIRNFVSLDYKPKVDIYPERDYYPVRFAFPEIDFKLTAGCDYGFDVQHRQILEKTGRMNKPFAFCSSDIKNRVGQNSLYIIKPLIYNAVNSVITYLEYIVPLQELMEGIALKRYSNMQNMNFELIDLDDSEHYILAGLRVGDCEKEKQSVNSLSYIYPIYCLGKAMAVRFAPDSDELKRLFTQSGTIMTTTIIGSLLSLFIAFVVYYRQRRNAMFEAMANKSMIEMVSRDSFLTGVINNLPLVALRIKVTEALETVFISAGIEAITGRKADVYMSGARAIEDDIYGDDRDKFKAILADCIKSEKQYSLDCRIVSQNSEKTFLVRISCIPHMDGNGTKDFVDGFMADITNKKEAEMPLRKQGEPDE